MVTRLEMTFSIKRKQAKVDFFVIRNLWFPPYMCCSASCRLTFEVARCLSFLAPKSLREQHMSFVHWEISFQKSSNPVPRLGFFFMKNESYSQIILYLRIWFLSNFWLLLIFFLQNMIIVFLLCIAYSKLLLIENNCRYPVSKQSQCDVWLIMNATTVIWSH